MSETQVRCRSKEQLLLTPVQMADIDRAGVIHGVLGVDLMEVAGSAVAAAVIGQWTRRPVLVLCGPGSNGGDGYVAARHLQAAGWPVRVASLDPAAPRAGDAGHHPARWDGPVEAFSPGLLEEDGVVVDARPGLVAEDLPTGYPEVLRWLEDRSWSSDTDGAAACQAGS